MKHLKWIIIPLIVILTLVTYYCYTAIQYQNRFVPGSIVGDIDVSKLSRQEAVSTIQNSIEKEEFLILDDGNVWKNISKEQFGISLDIEGTVDRALANQNPWIWILAYSSTQENVPITTTSYNENELSAQAADIKKELIAFNKNRTATENARIEDIDGAFQIVNEIQGNTIDVDLFIASFESEVKQGQNAIDMKDYLEKPSLTANDTALQKELEEINRIAEVSGSHLINGQEVPIPKETLRSWVLFNDKKEVFLDEDAMRDYVVELGNQYNTSTNATDFKSSKQGTVSVPAGALSWTIATDVEVAQLKELILNGEDFSGHVPAYQGSGSPATPLIGNTYIEVDLKEQHMWYYEDGKVALDTKIISGKPSTKTPPGVFYVWHKEENAILKGEDYASPVDYWMPIDWTGVGIHDSAWQAPDAYGGDSYKTVGSHGCINTPPNVAGDLFKKVSIGTPVVVF